MSRHGVGIAVWIGITQLAHNNLLKVSRDRVHQVGTRA